MKSKREEYMIKKEILLDSDKRKGKRKKEYIYSKTRNGKDFNLKPYNNMKIRIDIPNVDRYYSIQSTMTCWITIQPDVQQKELDNYLFLLRKRIRNKIREWQQEYFRQESIVIIDTADLPITRRTQCQYLTIEITHFIMDKMIYNKNEIQNLLWPFLKEIIDVHLCIDDVFTIIRNKKMEARKNIIARNRNERRENERI